MITAVNLNGKVRYFRRGPEISGKDIDAFGPFPADDQATYGIVFRLKNSARMRLSAVTGGNTGRYLLGRRQRARGGLRADRPRGGRWLPGDLERRDTCRDQGV